MFKTIKEFSNFDVHVITKELDSILLNGTISNIYEIEGILIIKINTISGKKNLVVKKDSRINLTEFNYPIPDYPSQYIISLRKLLKSKKILKVFQYKFDRIIIIELNDYTNKTWKFVIELFNKGNFLLLDENNIILMAKKYRKFKDRNILAKNEYLFPKSSETNFLTINKEEFKNLFKSSQAEIVRDLSRKVRLSGLYSEEICYRAGIDKNIPCIDLTDENFEKLYNSLKKLRNDLLFGKINAQIVFNKQGIEFSVIPFELDILKSYEKKNFSTFNKAVDEFFSKIDSETIISPKDEKIEKKIEHQEKILKNQEEYLQVLKNKKEKYYQIGDYIFANFNILEKLISVILNAKNKGYNWEEITQKLLKAKNEKINEVEFFENIDPSTNQLIIKIENENVSLDLRRSIGENANIIYSKGKKAEKKIKGTVSAIEKTKEKIKKLKKEKDLVQKEIEFLIKKPQKKWYEKFRWFITSEGFLVIGGRDATTNEIIFKKYLDPHDLVFHTIFPGSPLTVIKNPENKNISSYSLYESAVFVASYSRAWKENWGVIDVFYVDPDQISKSPPSGEFLQKGSFIISGKKNFIKNVKTELTIGLKFSEIESGDINSKILYPKIICGPESAIKKQTQIVISLIPSKSSGIKKGKIGKDIKSYFINIVEEKLKKWVHLLSIDEILLYLPNGLSKFKEI